MVRSSGTKEEDCMSRRKCVSAPFSLFAFQDLITATTGIILLITLMMAVDLVQNVRRAEAAPQEDKSPHVASLLRHAVNESASEIDRLQKILDETSTIRFDADSLRRRLAELTSAAKELESQNEKIQTTQEKINARREQHRQNAKDLTPEAIDALAKEQAAIASQIETMKETNRVIFNRPAGAAKTPWLVELNETSILAAEIGHVRAPQSFPTADAFLQWVQDQDRNSQYFVLLVRPASIETFSTVRKSLQDRQFDVGYDLLRSDQTAIDSLTGAGVQ